MPLALLALALGTFGIGTTEFVIMGLLPEVADGLGVGVAEAGHLISAYAVGVVVGAPLLAGATVRLPRRPVLIALMGVFALGNLLSAVAPDMGSLLAVRFLTGLPHGAFFGAASVAAAAMVSRDRRATAVSRVFLGLTIANVVGVPLGTLLGQAAGWRATFAVVGVIGLVAAGAVAAFVPAAAPAAARRGALRAEVATLRHPQVVLSLAAVIFGFGAMFACYSYVAPMLTEEGGFSAATVTVLLAVVGLGMTAGSVLGGRAADRAPLPTLYGCLVALAGVLVSFVVTVHHPVLAVLSLFGAGMFSLALGPAIQTRILDLVGDAPTMASAAIQSASNIANSLGAWLGGMVIAAGLGYLAPALVGAVLAIVGLAVLALSGGLEVRVRRRESAAALA
ncbi:MFS transporter [Actinomycetospora cinnamomea]|uniref:DHA1 family inner membrane transport protein n=1 Tax=Actinomycetospora cinnamomea TaxID=663609 RepID=A0A2U1FIT4_9PSEU|nr:MFS transporter [Actinomycetospora cinnamomea]PVZ12069.1 DHA1 family inner membrane transport protein [Actinomycetospora cinnamomea]